jgi:hypothetical protein
MSAWSSKEGMKELKGLWEGALRRKAAVRMMRGTSKKGNRRSSKYYLRVQEGGWEGAPWLVLGPHVL